MRVTVKTFNNESKLEANPTTRAKDLFSLMTKTLGLQESWYFGMSYDENNEEIWIDLSKKRLKAFQSHVSRLNYKVKYYPEEVSEELIERVTIEYFYNHVKNGIVNDKIFCPADTCVLLASYALQVTYGDYNADEHNESTLQQNTLLPDRVLKQHSMDAADWLKSITNLWTKHRGLDDEDAMLEYLKIAQNLEMYGVSYFSIFNKRGTEVYLGVTALGLNIYEKDDILNPKTTFPWSEIKQLKVKNKRFTIQPTNKTANSFVFFTKSPKTSKTILNLGIGNHALYIRRRKPEAPEIAKLREKNQQIRKQRALDKQKINNEKRAREELERREIEYKREIALMRESMAKNEESLLDAQKTIKKLQEQLDELRKSKEELENQRLELQQMMERLEQSKNLEMAEKQKLEDEIRAKHEEVERIQEEVRLKDEETRRLQEEIEEAHRREEQKRLEEAERLEQQQRLNAQLEEASLAGDLEELPEGDNKPLPEIHVNDQHIKDELKLIQDKLEKTRTEEEDTELDKIHKVNLLLGRDKFKTLADIRRGNTIRRVELFENM